MTLAKMNMMSGQSNTPLIRVPASLFCALTPLVVAIRFWSRRYFKTALGSDDWTILGPMIFSLADCSCLLTACSYGFGKHSSSLNPADKIMALKLFYCSQIMYKISLNLTKVSILLLYMRAFTLRPFRTICWILLGVVVAYSIGATVATVLQCTPISRAWDKSILGTCFNLTAFWYSNASYAIITDLILLALPIRVIWSLKLRTMQKFAVLVVFALGGVVTVCSIIRMTTLTASSTTSDATYEVASTSLANVESNIAILCACLPIFRRPLATLFPRLFSSLGGPSEPSSAQGRVALSSLEIRKTPSRGDVSRYSNSVAGAIRAASRGRAAMQDGGSDDFFLEHLEDVSVDMGNAHRLANIA